MIAEYGYAIRETQIMRVDILVTVSRDAMFGAEQGKAYCGPGAWTWIHALYYGITRVTGLGGIANAVY